MPCLPQAQTVFSGTLTVQVEYRDSSCMVATSLKFQLLLWSILWETDAIICDNDHTEVFAKLLDSMSLDIWTVDIENSQPIIVSNIRAFY